MTDSNNISSHLEMMLNKKSRCEDWVTSVNLRKSCTEEKSDIPSEEDYSDVCNSSEVLSRRVRKTVNNKLLPVNLKCGWIQCDFSIKKRRNTFYQHVAIHAAEVAILRDSENNQYYRCLWDKCSFGTANGPEMKRHVTFHGYLTNLKAVALSLQVLWELPACTLQKNSKYSLPDFSFPFECRALNCDFVTDAFTDFIDHVNLHVDDLNFKPGTSLPCFWIGCSKFKFNRRVSMKSHMRSHTGERTLACPTCEFMFSTNTKFMDHCTRKIPFQDECNQCQYCLRYYPNDRLLRDHMRYHINSQKCPFCEMTFSTPAVLSNHIRCKHIDAQPFECNKCDFKTVRAHEYSAHQATHNAEPKYKCEECEFSCRAVVTLKKHFNAVHLKMSAPIYQCHLCENEYTRGTFLGKHLRLVHKLERLPGHSRFRYMEDKDGYYRLQVERYESLELNNMKASFVPIKENTEEFVIKEENGPFKKYTIIVDNKLDESEFEFTETKMEMDCENKKVHTFEPTQEEFDGNGAKNFDSITADTKRGSESNCHNESTSNEMEVQSNSEVAGMSPVKRKNSTDDEANLKKKSFCTKKVMRRRKMANFSDIDCISNDVVIVQG